MFLTSYVRKVNMHPKKKGVPSFSFYLDHKYSFVVKDRKGLLEPHCKINPFGRQMPHGQGRGAVYESVLSETWVRQWKYAEITLYAVWLSEQHLPRPLASLPPSPGKSARRAAALGAASCSHAPRPHRRGRARGHRLGAAPLTHRQAIPGASLSPAYLGAWPLTPRRAAVPES